MTHPSYVDLGFACVDTDRQKRRGFPEVIFCQQKTIPEIVSIARSMLRHRQLPLLMTRVSPSKAAVLKKKIKGLHYHPQARAATIKGSSTAATDGEALIMTGGTSDIPVAEEAAVTLDMMGVRVRRVYDVGVAGVHRVLDRKHLLDRARVIIVAAGMEGALASLVSGLSAVPVIAVPTSCGYGASFEGLAALLTMLNSCSPGVAVVNIDNGFGAGYFAGLIMRNNVSKRADG